MKIIDYFISFGNLSINVYQLSISLSTMFIWKVNLDMLTLNYLTIAMNFFLLFEYLEDLTLLISDAYNILFFLLSMMSTISLMMTTTSLDFSILRGISFKFVVPNFSISINELSNWSSISSLYNFFFLVTLPVPPFFIVNSH